jgi:glycine/D-amino acid oxidase-like deaminating enzyme
MILGSLRFEDCLRRWGVDDLGALSSRPFVYGVCRSSLLDAAAIELHFAAVAAEYESMRAQLGLRYFGDVSPLACERMTPASTRHLFDDRHVAFAHQTIERSIQPQALAVRLRAAVAAASRVRFLGGTLVRHVRRRADDRLEVAVSDGSPDAVSVERYDAVVNALWTDRLRIDASLGLRPTRPWVFRFKLSVHLAARPATTGPPSTTLVFGPYGDVVNFGDGHYYLSWYPACRLGSWQTLEAPAWLEDVGAGQRQAALSDTLSALSTIIPSVAAIDLRTAAIRVDGGTVFSWGRNDITDLASEIHQRFDIGPHSLGNYHTVDTGKYCMAPWFAVCVADRICGNES